MTYQTGTASHQDDLIDKLRIFALADGWTVNKFVAGSGNGYSSQLYLQKGSEAIIAINSTYVGGNNYYQGGPLTAQNRPQIRIYGATGFDTNLGVSAQPGTGYPTHTDWIVHNIVNYRFFSDGGSQPYIHVVVESTPLEYKHFGFGVLIKAGAYDGGLYAYGTVYNQSAVDYYNPIDTNHSHMLETVQSSSNDSDWFRCNVDTNQYKYMRHANSPNTDSNAYGVHSPITKSILSGFIYNWSSDRGCTPNEFNGVSPMANIPALIERAGLYVIIGCFPDLRLLNIRNHDVASTLVLGSDTWHLFPANKKGDPDTGRTANLDGNSGWLGFAFKEVT